MSHYYRLLDKTKSFDNGQGYEDRLINLSAFFYYCAAESPLLTQARDSAALPLNSYLMMFVALA